MRGLEENERKEEGEEKKRKERRELVVEGGRMVVDRVAKRKMGCRERGGKS